MLSVNVGATPGLTKSMQEIQLDNKVKLLDCPGVVMLKSGEADACIYSPSQLQEDRKAAGGDCGGKAWLLGAVAGAAVADAAAGAGFAFRLQLPASACDLTDVVHRAAWSRSETLVYGSNLLPVMEFPKHEESREKSLLRFSNVNTRRLMIGSRVPLCTYNECRGCRFKCSAEQVPVDESDPINSAYRYRCRCHA
ncbi:hypothetical protein ZIOFF_016323 [Zingiber officinale]|uniref:Stomagen C-terminal domain-containing protein n=1 Tax=Zingiber officinale TaxID=94328 RepID=A0A8J5HL57_ZINOF|nr:hypothetical protein ZIOFF_016323 [Zingiber officinale]